jgi:hypothetical protein
MYSPISNICVVRNTSYRPTALIAVPVVFDLLLLILTVLKAFRSPALLKSDSIVRVKFQSRPTWKTEINSPDVHVAPGRSHVRGTASVYALYSYMTASQSLLFHCKRKYDTKSCVPK